MYFKCDNIITGKEVNFASFKVNDFALFSQIKKKAKVMFVQEDYPKYTSFLTVRHPFERLVSAYEHKVLRNHAKYLHNATFEEFIRKFVIKEAQKCPHYNHCMNLHWMPYIR